MSTPPIAAWEAAEINKQALILTRLLNSLPVSIPLGDQLYNFQNYAPSEASLELCESEDGALNRDLECIFCPRGRADGIEFRERGPGLIAVAGVLRTYASKYPQNVVLQKWFLDLRDAATAHGAVSPV